MPQEQNSHYGVLGKCFKYIFKNFKKLTVRINKIG